MRISLDFRKPVCQKRSSSLLPSEGDTTLKTEQQVVRRSASVNTGGSTRNTPETESDRQVSADPAYLRAWSQLGSAETSELRNGDSELHHWLAQERGLHGPAHHSLTASRAPTCRLGVFFSPDGRAWSPVQASALRFMIGEGMAREHGCV